MISSLSAFLYMYVLVSVPNFHKTQELIITVCNFSIASYADFLKITNKTPGSVSQKPAKPTLNLILLIEEY